MWGDCSYVIAKHRYYPNYTLAGSISKNYSELSQITSYKKNLKIIYQHIDFIFWLHFIFKYLYAQNQKDLHNYWFAFMFFNVLCPVPENTLDPDKHLQLQTKKMC